MMTAETHPDPSFSGNDNDNVDASSNSSSLGSSSVGEDEEEESTTRFDSSHNHHHHHQDKTTASSSSSNEDAPSRNIAKHETAAVFRLRVVVIVVLLITASVVSAVVLRITQQGEQDEFETQFAGASHVVQASFEDVIDKLSVLSALAVVDDDDDDDDDGNAASAAWNGGRGEWPFRTLYNFKERATNARYASQALSVAVCPTVTIDKREAWEAYVNGPGSSWM